MRKILTTLFLLFICCYSYSQTWNIHSKEYIADDSLRKEVEKAKKIFNAEQKAANWNFKFEDGKVYWQKIFEHPIEDSTAVREYFDNNPIFTKNNNGYTAKAALSEYSTQSNMNIPFILHSPADMVFYVQYKEGKYRVTLTNCAWTGKAGTTGMIAMMQDVTLSLNDLASKSGKFKSGCKSTNICLLNLFDYKTKLANKEMLNSDF